MLERISELIREHMEDENLVICEESDLITDLGLNSLDLVSLACLVEDEYEIEIPDRAIRELRTVKDVMCYIEKLQK